MSREVEKELMKVFRTEAQDLINRMEKELNLFRNDIECAYDISRIEELFRYAHTLKGSSDSAGFTQMNKIAALLTEIFSDEKDGKTKMTIDSIHLLIQAVEACQKLLDGEEVEDIDELMKQLDNM